MFVNLEKFRILRISETLKKISLLKWIPCKNLKKFKQEEDNHLKAIADLKDNLKC